MIEPQKWVAEALAGLQKAFGPRLAYLGLQGSYRRGEATESSDIDLVTLLDKVSLNDLDTYRLIVQGLPEGDKACGFICGLAEFDRWPRHELFPFKMDTADYHGRLEDFIPPVSRGDIIEGVRIGASNLLHLMRHSYIHAAPEAKAGLLKEGYKAAFFVILVHRYLTSGTYHRSKRALLADIEEGPEKIILAAGLDFPAWLSTNPETEAFEILIGWARGLLTGDLA